MDTEQPLTRHVVLDARLADPVETRRVEARHIRMAARFAPGAHTHNGPVVGSIESGSVLFQVAGGPPIVLGPGELFFEPAGVVVEHFDALDEDVTFLAFFPLGADQVPEIVLTGRP